VVRGGHKDQVSSWDLLVGDLIELTPGDEVPADGIFLHGTTKSIDESSLTGESHQVKKNEENPFLFSGCQVAEGTGFMIATAVSERSSEGQIQKILNGQQGIETVLQDKLKVVTVQIGKFGVIAGVATFLALAIRLTVNW
jgi:Ca2+-transporting ATPase